MTSRTGFTKIPLLSKRLLLIVAGALVLVILGFVGWMVYLDRIVTNEFQGRLWSVPARVYAAPRELYVGAPTTADDLELELRRLHYQPGDPATGPGFFRRRGGDFDLHARRVQFIDELRPATRITIHANAEGITGLSAIDGSEVPVFRLDPLMVGSVFPIHGEDRIIVTPDEVSAQLRNALKTIEDRRFDEHHGVDPRSILRAVWANLRARRIAQGGSTLTQQLVKNYFLTDAQTFGRKLKEAVMAMRLEARFSKEEILVAYINEVSLGQDGQRAIHGFGLGSEFYFGKPLSELDIGEQALLIGLVRGPSFYDPVRHPDRAKARRNLVLQELASNQVITEDEAKRASAKPLVIRSRGGGYFPAYMDLVRRHLKRDYAEADLSAAGLAIFTTLDPRAQASAEQALSRGLARLNGARRDKSALLEGAVIVAEPQSGDVLAIVGGRDFGREEFNRALDAKRPIGSLVKPAVYLSALETGRYTAASVLLDAPLELKLGDGSIWAPQNYTREEFGSVSMVHALAESMNLATVRLGLDVGLDHVADTLVKLGLERRPALNPSLLLGAVEMTPLEVVQMYTSLANGGFKARLHTVRAVLDEKGKALKSFKVEVEAVAAPELVYQVDSMMVQVTQRGTGRGVLSKLGGIIAPAKTGTSQDTRDSWFAGFTGSHLAVVWVGFDDNRSTGLTGALGALPIWADTISTLRPASWEPAPPPEVEERWIEFSTGLVTAPTCSNDAVKVAVPRGASLPIRPGCAAALVRNGIE